MADTTIVIPCFNEARRLNVDAFVQHATTDVQHRFLFVNDGSTDQTLDVLLDLQSCDSDRFSVLDLPRNGGKAEAVRQGVLAAIERRPKFVGYWDADLATPLDAIEPFRQRLLERTDIEVIFGARIRMLGRAIDRHAHRHYLGRIFATVASMTLRMGVYDTQCGAKLFRVTHQTTELFQRPFITGWIFDVELIARLLCQRRLSGGPSAERVIFEQPLERWCDVAGSKVRPRDFFKAMYELLAIYRTYLRRLPSAPKSRVGQAASAERIETAVDHPSTAGGRAQRIPGKPPAVSK